jgi:hypothetical protein
VCRSCDGNFPAPSDHRALSDAAAALRRRVALEHLKADDDQFIREGVSLDQLRFKGPLALASPEWGQPQTAPATARYIFRAPDLAHALTLFVLACWYDAQEQYVTVWSRRIAQLDQWMHSREKSEATLPSARSGPWTRSIAWKTWQRCESGGFQEWLAGTINSIAEGSHGPAGNTYRLIGRLARELTSPGQTTRGAFAALEAGHYSPAMFKRAWMLMMFLRRDQGVIRCVLERSLAGAARGAEAVERWYDDGVFSQLESELPVDKRMLTIGRELFGTPSSDEAAVLSQAHSWGQEHGLAPSTLDALFFAMD